MAIAKRTVHLSIPPWVGKLYVLLSVILVPWTVYLGSSLPIHHLSNHWDVSWTGLDIALAFTLLLTGIFAYTKSIWIVISSATAGSLLIVDAWFDVMSERQAVQFREALLMAFFFELPLALISYFIAVHALKRKTN